VNWRFIPAGMTVVIVLAFAPAVAKEKTDRHAGYYYPKPASVEVYRSRARTLPEANRRQRIGFVTGVVNGMLNRSYPPVAALFAKGSKAQKLIIVSNQAGRLDTIYRVRALLATLTSSARATPIFREYKVEDTFNFFDMAKMLGFELITVSDGDTFTHQVVIK
jgi:hypothetical protein